MNMDIVKKYYNKFESNLSATLRILMVVAVTAVLLVSIYNVVIGYFKSNAEANLETKVTGIDFNAAEELLFATQEKIEVDEKKEEAEEEEVPVDPRVQKIHNSIRLHFTDKTPNEEQFDDEERGLTPRMLENLINYYGAGDYTIGLAPQNWSSRQLVFPINEIEGCRVGARVPKLSEDQQKQMVDQLVSFWKKAEKGTDEKKSKFMQIRSYSGRIQQIMVANDLFLCEFNKSLSELSVVNAKLEMEANEKATEGNLMIAAAVGIMNVMFKFFAAFAAVLLALILYRVEKSLRK
jgi:hypothetical protein